MATLKKIISSPFGVKLYFVIIAGLAEVPILSPYFVGAIKYGLIWALCILIVDSFTQRRFMKSRNIGLFVLMLLSYLVTIIINYTVALQSNVLNYFYMVLIFFVFYPPPALGDAKGTAKNQMYILNYILVIMITIMSIVGLCMFVVQYSSTIELHGLKYNIGFAGGRQTGIFRNAIYPTAAIAIVLAVVQLVLLKLRNVKSKWIISLLILSIVINYWHIALADSRGIIFGLIGFIFVFSLFALQKKLKEKEKLRTATRAIISLCVATILSVCFFYSISLTRAASAYIPALVSTTQTEDATQTANPPQATQNEIQITAEPVEMERYVAPENYGVLTGRMLYWRYALDEVPKNLFFGTGPFYHSTMDTRIAGLSEKFSHFHNVFVHTLVGVGIVGLALFVLILALSAWMIIRFLAKSKNKNSPDYLLVAALLSFLVFLIVINLADTTIILIIKQSGFIFWIYLGYAMVFVDDAKPFVFDKPFIALGNKLAQRRKLRNSDKVQKKQQKTDSEKQRG